MAFPVPTGFKVWVHGKKIEVTIGSNPGLCGSTEKPGLDPIGFNPDFKGCK
jgi:hypothetical protein